MSAVESFWRDFADASGVDAGYSAWAFGSDDDPRLQAKLGSLVRDGPKRATTGLLSEYEEEGEALPAVGDYGVILDGRGGSFMHHPDHPRRVAAVGEVDAEFAWIEGEGDRSLDYWRQAHLGFFDQLGIEIDDGTTMVLERFDLVPRPVTFAAFRTAGDAAGCVLVLDARQVRLCPAPFPAPPLTRPQHRQRHWTEHWSGRTRRQVRTEPTAKPPCRRFL